LECRNKQKEIVEGGEIVVTVRLLFTTSVTFESKRGRAREREARQLKRERAWESWVESTCKPLEAILQLYFDFWCHCSQRKICVCWCVCVGTDTFNNTFSVFVYCMRTTAHAETVSKRHTKMK
jgi:hypothetical protein